MRIRLLAAVAVAVAASALTVPPAGAAQAWSRVGGKLNGQALSGVSGPDLTDDGRVVAFSGSFGGSNYQVATYDRRTRRIAHVSTSYKGGFADGFSGDARISGDGRYVLFVSSSRNVLAADRNDQDTRKVYVRDLKLGRTTRLFRGVPGWHVATELSGDGRYAFHHVYIARPQTVAGVPTTGNDVIGLVYRADVRTGKSALLRLLDPAGRPIDVGRTTPVLPSRDGRYLAFFSDTSGAGPADVMVPRLYVADLVAGKTREIPTGELFHPVMSAPITMAMDHAATTIAFRISDLRYDDRRIWIADVRRGTLKSTLLPADWQGASQVSISGNGRTVLTMAHSMVADPTDMPTAQDVVAYDVPTGKLSLWLAAGGCPVSGPLATVATEQYRTYCSAAMSAPAQSFDGRTVAVWTVSRKTSDDTDDVGDIYVVTGS